MKRRWIGWGVAAFALFLGVNAAVIPSDPFIPPSRFFLNETFTYKLARYKEKESVDLVIMGNSRVDCCIDPGVMAATLEKSWKRPVTVQTLTTGGGYFPFYNEVLTRLLRDQPPKRLLLGLNPRDFNRNEGRVTKVLNRLQRSSGHILDAIPYASFFHWLEGRLADSLAAAFPVLYYRSRTLAGLIPEPLAAWARPRYDEEPGFWKQSIWNALTNLPMQEQVFPRDGADYLARLKSYPGRLGTLTGWRPPKWVIVDERGWWVDEDPGRHFPLEELQAVWDRQEAEGMHAHFRDGAYCDKTYQLNDGPDALHRSLFRYLDRLGVEVWLALGPAKWLEGCENNRRVNAQLQAHLQTLKEEHASIRGIIDLNNDFDHPWLDMTHYNDHGEHMMRAPGAEVSRIYAERIAREGAP